MFKSILMIFALFLGFSLVTQAQEFKGIEFNAWLNGTGYTTPASRALLASRSDTTEMVSLDKALKGDTLIELVWYATADTAQASCIVDYFSGTKYLGSSTVDSLVYGFNTNKLSPVAAINVWTSRIPGATHVRGRSTQSATYNKDGTEGSLKAAIITRD